MAANPEQQRILRSLKPYLATQHGRPAALKSMIMLMMIRPARLKSLSMNAWNHGRGHRYRGLPGRLGPGPGLPMRRPRTTSPSGPPPERHGAWALICAHQSLSSRPQRSGEPGPGAKDARTRVLHLGPGYAPAAHSGSGCANAPRSARVRGAFPGTGVPGRTHVGRCPAAARTVNRLPGPLSSPGEEMGNRTLTDSARGADLAPRPGTGTQTAAGQHPRMG